MSQLNHRVQQPQQQAQTQATAVVESAEELQRINDDAAAARHLTAIRIRGQHADAEGSSQQG